MRVPLILVLSVLLSLLACTPKDIPPLKIGSNVRPGYELYYLARSMGVLDSKQVRLVEFSSATDVSHQLVNGNLQGALLTLDEAVRLQQAGLNLKVVQIVDFSRGGDAVMARQTLGDREDFVGKSIAVEGSAVGALMLSSFIRQLDIPAEYLNLQYISVDESEDAFKSGADFVVTFEPFRTKLLNQGAIQVFDSRAIPNLIVDVLVVREDHFFEAVDYFKSEPVAASKLLAKRLKITPEEAIASYDGIKLASLGDNENWLTGDEPLLIESTNTIGSILLESNLITGTVDLEDLLLKPPVLPAYASPE